MTGSAEVQLRREEPRDLNPPELCLRRDMRICRGLNAPQSDERVRESGGARETKAERESKIEGESGRETARKSESKSERE